ncbi:MULTISPECIES: hypothetical protein [unclassified Methylobacterium]|uniref:hypothetical protein n=1 Tax=unclassified Methylobacterium TaxID=2615210 RepID=UPI002269BDDE|nr:MULTISPECIES: hypothetical protein [unclassified Methylobacterium]
MPDPTRAMASAPVKTVSGARHERRDRLLSWPSGGTVSIAMQMPMLLVGRGQAGPGSSRFDAWDVQPDNLLRSGRNSGSERAFLRQVHGQSRIDQGHFQAL